MGITMGRLLGHVIDESKIGGYVGDILNAGKLTKEWSNWLYGTSTPKADRISEHSGIGKLFCDFISLPEAAKNSVREYKHLDGRFLPRLDRNKNPILDAEGNQVPRYLDSPVLGIHVRRIVEFVSSNLTFFKNFHGAVDLGNKVTGEELVTKETLKFWSPISGFATTAFGLTQVVFENGPELHANMTSPEGKSDKAISAFLKLIKHTALIGVGALALVAAFYCPIPAIAIPVLLTVSLVFSVASRFFDGLLLADDGPQPLPVPNLEVAANAAELRRRNELQDRGVNAAENTVTAIQNNTAAIVQVLDVLRERLLPPVLQVGE